MATGEDYSPSGTFPTFPLSLVKDGEIYNFDSIQKSGDPKKGLIAKLIDAVGYLYNNLSSAVLAAANTWAGKQTFAGGVVMTSQFVPRPAATAISPSASAATIDATVSGFHYIDTPTQSTVTITLKSTSPVPANGSEVEFAAYAIANGNNVNIEREDHTQPTTMTGSSGTYDGFGSAKFKFIGGVWRLMSATGLANEGINNP